MVFDEGEISKPTMQLPLQHILRMEKESRECESTLEME